MGSFGYQNGKKIGDAPDQWPRYTAVYEPEVLTRERWSQIVYFSPSTLVTLPDGVTTIARVPVPVAEAVAGPGGTLPAVSPDDIIAKRGDGVWKVDWDVYLSRNWKQVHESLYDYNPPTVNSVLALVISKNRYGAGYNKLLQSGTPLNQLDTSATPRPWGTWVPGTIDNVKIRGQELFQSPAHTHDQGEPAAFEGTGGTGGGGVGPGVAEVHGAGIPIFSKCNCV